MTTETRVFTVEVTGCCDCPHIIHGMCYHSDTHNKPKSKREAIFYENQDTITPSCPMHGQSFLKQK